MQKKDLQDDVDHNDHATRPTCMNHFNTDYNDLLNILLCHLWSANRACGQQCRYKPATEMVLNDNTVPWIIAELSVDSRCSSGTAFPFYRQRTAAPWRESGPQYAKVSLFNPLGYGEPSMQQCSPLVPVQPSKPIGRYWWLWSSCSFSSVPVSVLRINQANPQSTLWLLQCRGSGRHICIRRQHLVIWPSLGSLHMQIDASGRILFLTADTDLDNSI